MLENKHFRTFYRRGYLCPASRSGPGFPPYAGLFRHQVQIPDLCSQILRSSHLSHSFFRSEFLPYLYTFLRYTYFYFSKQVCKSHVDFWSKQCYNTLIPKGIENHRRHIWKLLFMELI